MDWSIAFELLLEGEAIRLPEWKGYWIWENDTIMIHCKDNTILDIRDTKDVKFTFEFTTRNDWLLCKPEIIKDDF